MKLHPPSQSQAYRMSLKGLRAGARPGLAHNTHITPNYLPTHLSFILQAYRVFLLLTFVVCIVYVYLFICLFSHICSALGCFYCIILTDCCIITCIHIFSSSAAGMTNKFSVHCKGYQREREISTLSLFILQVVVT